MSIEKKLRDLEEGEVVAIELLQDRSRFSIRVVTVRGEVCECILSNPDRTPTKVNVSWLDARLLYDPETKSTALGELEQAVKHGEVYDFEGDFGWIQLTAGQCRIKA